MKEHTTHLYSGQCGKYKSGANCRSAILFERKNRTYISPRDLHRSLAGRSTLVRQPHQIRTFQPDFDPPIHNPNSRRDGSLFANDFLELSSNLEIRWCWHAIRHERGFERDNRLVVVQRVLDLGMDVDRCIAFQRPRKRVIDDEWQRRCLRYIPP